MIINTEKNSSPYDFPEGAPYGYFAKGQTDTPINHYNQEEVLRPHSLPFY